ncbi:hypothetical protein V499_08363 [Pseudogymnoascus sp. VKM F-103]|nr:hypothetical protein V499_08363 [Pseudogymnoascus sp. VKM F-103]
MPPRANLSRVVRLKEPRPYYQLAKQPIPFITRRGPQQLRNSLRDVVDSAVTLLLVRGRSRLMGEADTSVRGVPRPTQHTTIYSALLEE